MAKYKLLLPKMGESVAEATIIRWTKSPGDDIAADETVMEIATDKVDSDVPSPVAGKLVEQLCKENDVVQVGAVIAIIETPEPEKELQAPPVYNAFHEPQPGAAEPHKPLADEVPERVLHEQPPEGVQPVAENVAPLIFEEHRDDMMQQVPFTNELTRPAKAEKTPKQSGRFYSPLVRSIAAQECVDIEELDKIPGTGAEGRLTKDDLLAYIENKLQQALKRSVAGDIATFEQEHEQITAEQPAMVTPPVDETLVNTSELVAEPAKHVQAAEPWEPVVASDSPKEIPVKPSPEPVFEKAAEPVEPVVITNPPKESPDKPSPQPVAEKAAEQPSPVKPSVSVSGGDEIIEMDRMRRLIAEHMVMSKQTSPHVTSFVEADVTNLVKWREKIKAGFEKREGVKITLTPLFIEAVAKAIKDMPMINVSVNGTQIIKKKDVNISMATALANGNLIVPVIKHADELNLIGLAKAVTDLADRARNNKLKPDDVQGGTFTITNVGSFGNVMGTPIINQPQVAILAVGAIKKKPAVIETLEGDMIAIRHMMFLSLSYDHRVVDGALGGSFLRRVADYLENWDTAREI